MQTRPWRCHKIREGRSGSHRILISICSRHLPGWSGTSTFNHIKLVDTAHIFYSLLMKTTLVWVFKDPGAQFSRKLEEGRQRLGLLNPVLLFLKLPSTNTISSYLAFLVLHHSSVATTTPMQAQQEWYYHQKVGWHSKCCPCQHSSNGGREDMVMNISKELMQLHWQLPGLTIYLATVQNANTYSSEQAQVSSW